MERHVKVQIECIERSFDFQPLHFEKMFRSSDRRQQYLHCLTDSNAVPFNASYFVGNKLKTSQSKRRSRTNFSSFQLLKLEATFQIHHYPDVGACQKLTKELGLTGSTIQVWFQNRRAKWRREENTRRGPGRPASNAPRTTCSGEPLPADEIIKKYFQKNLKKKHATNKCVPAIFDPRTDDSLKQRGVEQTDWSVLSDRSPIRTMQSTIDIQTCGGHLLKSQESPHTILKKPPPCHSRHPNHSLEFHGRIKSDVGSHLPFNIENLLS